MRYAYFVLITCIFSCHLKAQEVDSIPVDYAKTNRYIRINYDNDFFSATDRYYTQGILMEYIAPAIHWSPVSHALIRLNKQAQNYYGLAFEQDCFTPLSIRHATIYQGERPYAATMFVSHFLTSIDPQKKRRLTTKVDLGILGPCAKCKEEQMNIHRWLVNIQPLGWQFQVTSDYIVNYSAQLEQAMFTRKYIEMIGTARARVGTLYDDVSTGALLRVGLMPSYFKHLGVVKNARSNKFQCYFVATGTAKFVGYNATMQGGLFNRTSIYIIPDDHIERFVFSASGGIVIAYKRVSLEYTKVYITPEFYKGLDHGWGHCNITICF